MGIKFQKSALPALFNFAQVRAAHQPHVGKSVGSPKEVLLDIFFSNIIFCEKSRESCHIEVALSRENAFTFKRKRAQTKRETLRP